MRQASAMRYTMMMMGSINNNNANNNNAHHQQHLKTCIMCGQKNAQQTLKLLDIPTRSVLQHTLCSKHIIPQHIAKTIWDVEGIYKYFLQFSKEKEKLHGEATTTAKRGRVAGFKFKHKIIKKKDKKKG